MQTRGIYVLFASLLIGCSSGGGPPGNGGAGGTGGGAPSCDASDELMDVEAVLGDARHACRDWIAGTYTRMATSGPGSASIWSRRTKFKTGVLVSAAHVMGDGWFGEVGTDIPARWRDPKQESSPARTMLVAAGSGVPEPNYRGSFLLFNPAIPAAESGHSLVDIHPRHDFHLSVVDAQQVADRDVGVLMGPLEDGELTMDDPQGLTTTAPTFAAAKGGDVVLSLGFPQVSGRLTANVARVLDDAEAEAAIEELAEAGDEEGRIAYDPEAEMILVGAASVGMSGGGVFDASGREVGVLVRGSAPRDVQYVRAVRMTFIAEEAEGAFNALTPAEQAAISPYIEPWSP